MQMPNQVYCYGPKHDEEGWHYENEIPEDWVRNENLLPDDDPRKPKASAELEAEKAAKLQKIKDEAKAEARKEIEAEQNVPVQPEAA